MILQSWHTPKLVLFGLLRVGLLFPTSPTLPPGAQTTYPIGRVSTSAWRMNGAPASCSSMRNFEVVLFISIMNVIPSAEGDRAAAPAGNSTIGTLQDSSSSSESWLEGM